MANKSIFTFVVLALVLTAVSCSFKYEPPRYVNYEYRRGPISVSVQHKENLFGIINLDRIDVEEYTDMFGRLVRRYKFTFRNKTNTKQCFGFTFKLRASRKVGELIKHLSLSATDFEWSPVEKYKCLDPQQTFAYTHDFILPGPPEDFYFYERLSIY